MSAYDQIKKLCDERGIAVTALEKELGFGRGSIGKMRTVRPSADRIQKIADYFGVSFSYLMTGEEPENEQPYYLDDDAREMAQFMYENPEYKVLFDASRKISKEDIGTVKAILDKFKNE